MSPYADQETGREHGRKYYAENKERIKQREREKYRRDRETIRARRRELTTPELRQQNAERERLRYAAYRGIVIKAYGSTCACCGESEILFLEIDHIQNDGSNHRKEIGPSSRAIIYWLIQNDFPDGFQLLCSNCNQGKKRNGGICPHKAKSDQFCFQVK